MLFGGEARRVQERDDLVEDACVAGHLDVVRDGEGEPGPVVGDPRPHALARMRQPPMLDVALGELAAGRADQMFSRQQGADRGQRHAVLQLVAESVGAAGLIEAGPRPEAAGERLIEQPAVQHDVHRAVGGLHLNGPEDVLPMAAHLVQHGVEILLPVLSIQRTRLCLAVCREEDDFYAGVWGRYLRSAPQGYRRPRCWKWSRASERRRAFQRPPVATDEIPPSSCLPPGKIGE